MERENRYYDQIMELNGMEDMKEEVRHWEILAENIGQFPLEQEILLPDYFWIAPSGSGKSMLLNLLANYLEDREIMTFTGNKKVIEFELGYCKKEESFGELSRLIEKISYEAGYWQCIYLPGQGICMKNICTVSWNFWRKIQKTG